MCTNPDHIGTTSDATKRHRITITGVTGTFAVGDMLSGTLYALECAGLGKGRGVKFIQADVWEKSPAGTQVKATLRLHVVRNTFTPAATNAPFVGPLAADYLNYGASIDVESALYAEIGDGAGTDPDYAKATKVLATPPIVRTNDTTNTLYVAVEIREAKTYAGADITIDLETLLY
jgi:hypothetical protein